LILLIKFITRNSFMAFKTFNQFINFTRTSAATFVGSNGLIQTTPASVNLLTFTQEFDNAVWGKTRATVTANAIAAPDGTLTADKLVDDTSASTTHPLDRSATIALSTTYTFSVYLKGAGRNFARILLGDSAGGNAAWVGVNLTTGATSTGTNGTGWAVGSASATSVGDDWWRVAITSTSAASTTGAMLIYGGSSTTSVVYTGDGTSGIFLWGAQLELGSTATTYTRNFGGLFPPRFDYDPVTLAPKGILIEEQRTNLFLQSETFDNA
jgi:hypothetical protein